MRPRRRLTTSLAVAALGSSVALAGCSSDDVKLYLCANDIERADVYNYYPGSDAADLHVLADRTDLEWLCGSFPGWGSIPAESMSYDPAERTTRAVTVLDLFHRDGSQVTVWIHRQPGYQSDAFVTRNDGAQFRTDSTHIPAYYLPHAEPITIDDVPQIP